MTDNKIAKTWKSAEVQLNQASDFLLHPDKFHIPEQDFEDYKTNFREEELQSSMIELENLAIQFGAKPAFWRRIKKVAETLNNKNKTEEYEQNFQKAILRTIQK